MVNRILAAETPRIEKDGFLWRGVPPQNLVAMGKTAKALDDVVMQFRPAYEVLVLRRLVQLQAKFLVGERFAVLEGKIEKTPERQRSLLVEAAFDGASGDGAGKLVIRE